MSEDIWKPKKMDASKTESFEWFDTIRLTIETEREENSRYKQALEHIEKSCDWRGSTDYVTLTHALLRLQSTARQALSGQKTEGKFCDHLWAIKNGKIGEIFRYECLKCSEIRDSPHM